MKEHENKDAMIQEQGRQKFVGNNMKPHNVNPTWSPTRMSHRDPPKSQGFEGSIPSDDN